jgi:hypothetical protein
MILAGENRRTQRKTCSSATLSATNPPWTNPGANPGIRIEKPATNRLSHDTAPMAVTLYADVFVYKRRVVVRLCLIRR